MVSGIAPVGAIFSEAVFSRRICSVSLKLETFPSRSIPLEKYLVPALNRLLREMSPKTISLPLIEADLIFRTMSIKLY